MDLNLAGCFQYISMGHILKVKIPQQKEIFDITIGLEFVENVVCWGILILKICPTEMH